MSEYIIKVGNNEWFLDPPLLDDSLKIWQEWKSIVMTNSQNLFKERNEWFKFRKFDLYDNLSNKVNLPKIYYRSNSANNRKKFSEVINNILIEYNDIKSVVIKQVYGHSAKEVSVLDLSDFANGAVFDMLHKTKLEIEKIDRLFLKFDYVVEQSLATNNEPIPFDFKVYCLGGFGRAVAIVDRNSEKPIITFVACDNWAIIPWDHIYADRPDNLWNEGVILGGVEIERAKMAAKEAERICSIVNSHDLFIGVDTYVPLNTENRDVYLGEITPRMGAIHGHWIKKSFLKYLLLGADREV
jgi:hypothetical protein